MTDVITTPTVGGPTLPQERRLVTAIPGPRSLALHARRQAAVASGVSSTLPIQVVAAGGGVLVDVDGNSLIDLGSGIAVVNVGNADTEVAAAVAAQAAAFTHTCFMITPYEGYVAVAEHLNRLTPGDHEKRSALFNSGAEAVENAVKIARHATGRSAVVVLDHAYHGRTNLTMALTAKSMPYKAGFGPFAPEVYRVPMAYPYRWPGGPDACGPEAATQAIDHIRTEIGADNVAAILVEPIQGEGGFIVPGEGYLPALVDFCREHGILFVADEIQTGFGRTGHWFASEHEGIVPDLVTTAKGIAGGLPLAGVTGRAALMDAVHVGGLGGTYGGNPVACAAAVATIELIERDGLVERAATLGDVLRARLEALAADDPGIGDVRGRGLMQAIELVVPGSTSPDPARVRAVLAACHAAGVVTLGAGTYGNVIRFLPPLVIGEDLLHEGLTVVADALAATRP
ncbi:4-aminobutyrate--2-oxoglutarate transaminase [Aquihabitans sp. G128]|uniref:4-aminobutyrate--2-oxoglutarate transaminase n=1 Tax=Aquihabitans sp. G128 TaxID=2849779 RepID=UPI001C21A8BA|nr:4-aminobutyrate--2-oxoglutarate transaminase [Aquihabitans sp. G128]QXC61331.1 4-aminobutyrate--2-oxoglutarate transaminase [Aquihabitans sp. G128]